jgi:hypothetical protein
MIKIVALLQPTRPGLVSPGLECQLWTVVKCPQEEFTKCPNSTLALKELRPSKPGRYRYYRLTTLLAGDVPLRCVRGEHVEICNPTPL